MSAQVTALSQFHPAWPEIKIPGFWWTHYQTDVISGLPYLLVLASSNKAIDATPNSPVFGGYYKSSAVKESSRVAVSAS